MGKYRTRREGSVTLFRSMSSPFEPVTDKTPRTNKSADSKSSFVKTSLDGETKCKAKAVDLSALAGLGQKRLEERSHAEKKESKIELVSIHTGPLPVTNEKELPPSTVDGSDISKGLTEAELGAKHPEESSHPDKKEGKIKLVPIRSRPPSLTGGEKLTPSISDDSAVSKIDTLPLYTASAPLPESPPDADVDEQPRLQNAGDQDNSTDKIETSSKKTSIYHFYHSGNRTENYEIHTISDKEAPLPQAHDPSAPYYVDDEKFREWRPSLLKRMLSLGRVEKEPAQRTIKRSIMIRNPKLDSRTATAPYFIHHPRIRDRRLPYTLRKGGSKNGPTICLFKGCWFWYHYKIVFDDRLADEGVIDGRGVVSARYGSKTGKNGTLKGHRFLMQRHPFETGKEWHKREKARRKEDKARTKAEKKLDFATPIKAEEIVFMRWTSILSLHPREYHFHWSGVDFYWKGTATVADEKLTGFTMGYCHLKLVAAAPPGPSMSTSKEKREKVKGHEVCLAKYTCTLAERKAGRLEVFDKTVTDFVDAYILPTAYQDVCDKEKGGDAEREAIAQKKHSRMEHLIIVTLTCMIQSESEKREAILELLLTAADAASNA